MLSDIRSQHPEYNDLSDTQLADAMHQAYYPDLDKGTVYQKLGLSLMPPVQIPTINNSGPVGIMDRLGIGPSASTISPALSNNLINALRNFGLGAFHGLNDVMSGISPQYGANALNPLTNPILKAANQMGAENTGSIPNIIGKIAGFGLGAAPIAAAGQAIIPEVAGSGLLSGIGSALRSGAIGGATGAATGGNNRLAGSALGFGLGAAAPIAGGIGNFSNDLLRYAKTENPDVLAQTLVDTLTTHLNPDGLPVKNNAADMNQRVVNDINKNYQNAFDRASGKLNDFVKNGKAAGYNDDVNMGLAGVSYQPNSKYISTDSDFNGAVDKLLNSNISDSLKNSLMANKNNPSLLNAKNLQSDLFQEKLNLQKINDKDTSDWNKINLLTSARESLLNNIESSLLKNGDHDLWQQFVEGRTDWRDNVVPYGETNATAKITGNKDVPKDMISALSNDKADLPAGSTKFDRNPWDIIRRDIAANPEQQANLAGLLFSKRAITDPKTGELQVPTLNLLNSFNQAPNTIKQMINPITQNPVSEIRQNYAIRNSVNPLLKNYVGKLSTGTAALGGYLLHKLL